MRKTRAKQLRKKAIETNPASWKRTYRRLKKAYIRTKKRN